MNPDGGRFPTVRLRRLRYSARLRDMLHATTLEPRQLVAPLFVREGATGRTEIASMPGVYQLSLDELEREAAELAELGVGGVILFGIPAEKDQTGALSCQDKAIIQQALARVQRAAPQLLKITDVCLCEYTQHGHCGVLTDRRGQRDVDNDPTLEILARQAVSHAQAGADIVAPSGMMDGMVGAIRRGLDEAGQSHVPILSYAVKYASAFYGPFRDAAESAPQFGDRRTYQMDAAAAAEQALREVALDLDEGADLVMVKPALAYLDILRLVRTNFPGVPLAAYNVSGEYSLVKAAAERGWIDERNIALEMLLGMRRAGADLLLTYWAAAAARWLR